MKLYFLNDKWKVDNNDNIIVPIFEKDKDTNCNSINLFNNILFDDDVLEEYDEKVNENIISNRIFYLFSIEVDNLDSKLLLENNDYYYTLKLLNKNINIVDYKKNYFYASDFQKLNWKMEKIICLNKNNFTSKFIINNQNDTENNIEELINIIIQGDSAERVVRLNNIIKDFNANMNKCAKELYEILYDFSCGDYYDINSEGVAYYNVMAFLRNKYNVDPQYNI